jgi:hypothetical protein
MDRGIRKNEQPGKQLYLKNLGKTGAIAVAIVWLAFTGGHAGWKVPVLVMGNIVAGCTVIYVWWAAIWGRAWSGSRLAQTPKRFGLAALAVVGAALISALAHPVTLNTSEWRLITMIGYVAVGYVTASVIGEEAIVRGSVWAGWVLLPAIILAAVTGHLWENRNIIAAFPVILAPIGLIGAVPAGDPARTRSPESPKLGAIGLAIHVLDTPQMIWLGLAVAAEIALGSLGGILGLLTALVITWRISSKRLIPAGLALIAVAAICRPDSIAWRLTYWRVAWDAFLSSSIVGIGPGSYYTLWPVGQAWYHAHNIVMTTAAETGLVGLAALGFAGWQLLQLMRSHPWAWQTAVIAGLLAHSLIDEPLQFWGPGLAFMVAVATLDIKND